jgi:hypothetical protein
MLAEMDSSAHNVAILYWQNPTAHEINAERIARFLGADVSLTPVDGARHAKSIGQLLPSSAAVVVHINTLVQMAGALDTGIEGILELINLSHFIFIYGFGNTERHTSIIRNLSFGGLLGMEQAPTTDTSFWVAKDHREWCRQFSGLSIRGVDPARDACFVEGEPHRGQSVLVRTADRPFFVSVNHGRSELFFSACKEVANLDERVLDHGRLLPWFSRLVPLMIFLRRALGSRIWHSDCPQACFIIDDPLLRPRYGFLGYQRLLTAMGQQKVSVSIAFIPWNYRRSSAQIADMFSTAPSSLSLCIHGCDHTAAEFAAIDSGLLRGKARLALDRMQRHFQLSGVPFDDVMVFPQGLFSSQALEALEACGYLAAVNTDPSPSDKPQALTLGDLIDVAVTRFRGVPLFGRHYPRDPAEFAFDLFLGKPALAVEHHGYFRNGYADLIKFVQQLNDLDGELEWHNLATICSLACSKKVAPTGVIHVRFYTHRFRLTNSGTQSETYVLYRQWKSEDPLPRVTLNGLEGMLERTDGGLTIALSLDPGQTADIRIVSERSTDPSTNSWKPTKKHNVRVFARRILCEFRDDYLATNMLMSKLLSEVHKLRAWKRRAQPDFSGSVN